MSGRSWRWRQLSRSARASGAKCVDCGTAYDLTLDHEVALAQGGRDTRANAVVRCRSCNARKGSRPPVRVQLTIEWAVSHQMSRDP